MSDISPSTSLPVWADSRPGRRVEITAQPAGETDAIGATFARDGAAHPAVPAAEDKLHEPGDRAAQGVPALWIDRAPSLLRRRHAVSSLRPASGQRRNQIEH